MQRSEVAASLEARISALDISARAQAATGLGPSSLECDRSQILSLRVARRDDDHRRMHRQPSSPAVDLAALRARVAQASRLRLGDDVSLDDSGIVVGRFLRAHLTTALEPVFALASGEVDGTRASLRTRARSDAGLSPWEVFANAAHDEELVRLDRLCRVVHALNVHARAPSRTQLTLPVHARLLDAVPDHHGKVFRETLESLGLGALRVAVELPVGETGDARRIAAIAASYRHHGFAVSVRPDARRQVGSVLQTVRPDAVSIDVSRLAELTAWEGTVRAAARAGLRVVVGHIRDAADIDLARDAGATHVHGPLFGAASIDADLRTPLSDRQGTLLAPVDRSAARRLRLQWVA